ncbi:MAG TPA: hypothetical protein VJB87_04320 [Candidatus Nanoarchaeia archaeon]|nr:hypothetical protein [Candidatus Nanoarchaeia archaeon]
MQRLKQAIKRMATIGTAVAMLGATISGAAAAGLADYPTPFVKNGVYNTNTAFVVGANAAASDTLGLAEIATNIQFQSKTCVAGSSGAGSTAISGDSIGISEGSDLLEVRETVGSVRETLTELDLDGLRGGIVTTDEGTTEYNQYLRFSVSGESLTSPQVNFTSNDANVEDVSDFLVVKEGANITKAFFEYELEFEEGLESDIVSNKLDDLEDEELVILGTVYNVVDTRVDTTNNEITLELLGGNVYDVLEEGEEKTYTVNGKDYKVEVLIIEDTSPETVTFRINGKLSDQLQEGETETLDDGILVGVSDLINNDAGEAGSGDLAEFYLGANKLELRDNEYGDDVFEQRVGIDNENIEDAFVQFKLNEIDSTSIEITSIKYRLTADALPGMSDVYVPAGHGVKEYLDEPQGMLGNWDLRYEGLTDTGVSLIKLDPSGDDQYKLTLENRQGEVYTIPYLSRQGGVLKYGDEDDEFIFIEGLVDNLTSSNTNIANFTPNIGDDDFFVLSDMDQGLDDTSTSKVVRYESIDTSNRQLLFDDLASGSRQFTYTVLNTNMSAIGRADLVFGGNTYVAYVENGTNANHTAGRAAGSGYRLAVDLNNDGDIRVDEVRFTTNGGGIIDFGRTRIASGNGVTIHDINISGVGFYDTIYGGTNATGAIVPKVVVGDTLVLGTGTNLTDANMTVLSLATLSENFDENTPASVKERTTSTSAQNEVLSIGFDVARANNEMGINTSFVRLGNSTWGTGNSTDDAAFDGVGVTFLEEPDANEDHDVGLTDYGAYVDLYDPSTSGSDAESMTIEYPLKQRGAEVFITMGDTTTTKTKGGEICTVANISPRTLLDSELGSRTSDYDIILVGGPCANMAVEKVEGLPTCSGWSYNPGEAIIQLADNGDHVALLVAGTDAIDTRMAAKVLANSEDYDLMGDSVMISGTLSSPKVTQQ